MAKALDDDVYLTLGCRTTFGGRIALWSSSTSMRGTMGELAGEEDIAFIEGARG
jgi:hypothetical protein